MLKAVSSITNAIGALNYKGTWNASTNSPNLGALTTAQKGDYYVVSVAGTTTLGGISFWGVGDWAVYNGSVWERVEGGANGEFTNVQATGGISIGTDAPNASTKLIVRSAASTGYVGTFINESAGNSTGLNMTLQSGSNNTDSWHFRGLTADVNAWFLYGNGTTSYSSDERLKKNIETTRDGYLDDLMKLRVVKYNWKNQADETPKELGLIAQEVEQVFPGLVQEHEMENFGTFKNIKHSVTEFILIKALQELKSELDLVKNELSQLKGN